MTPFNEMKLACLEVQLVSLEARRREAHRCVTNPGANRPAGLTARAEYDLLTAQVAAIRLEIQAICPGLPDSEEAK